VKQLLYLGTLYQLTDELHRFYVLLK